MSKDTQPAKPAEVKPAEVKPVVALIATPKPAEVKPVEVKPVAAPVAALKSATAPASAPKKNSYLPDWRNFLTGV
jgi:hypothetical protein